MDNFPVCSCKNGFFEYEEGCLPCDNKCKSCLSRSDACQTCKGNRINIPDCDCPVGTVIKNKNI
jgi:proprotein convertase subtilisin/kexin type 5